MFASSYLKPSWYELLIGFLIWTSASKYLHLTTFSNIWDFIHVLIFATVSKCRKSPKLTNIVILDNPWKQVSSLIPNGLPCFESMIHHMLLKGPRNRAKAWHICPQINVVLKRSLERCRARREGISNSAFLNLLAACPTSPQIWMASNLGALWGTYFGSTDFFLGTKSSS
jgi:hypothetical protein